MPQKVDLYDYLRFKKSIPHLSNYPIISNVVVSGSGLVTWDTDVPSTSQVFYGVVPYFGFNTPYDSSLVTSHTVVLSGLSVGVLYYLKVQSFNKDALSISDLYTFIFTQASINGFILASPNTTLWAGNVLTNGSLDTEITLTGSAQTITLIDANLVYWSVTIDNTGHLITISGASPSGAVNNIVMIDSSSHPWLLTVSITGDLTTT